MNKPLILRFLEHIDADIKRETAALRQKAEHAKTAEEAIDIAQQAHALNEEAADYHRQMQNGELSAFPPPPPPPAKPE